MQSDISSFTRLFTVFFMLIVMAITLVSGCRLIDNGGDNNSAPAATSTISGSVVKPMAPANAQRGSDRPAILAAYVTGAGTIAGAEVCLEDLASDPRFRTFTNASGTYLFTDVPPGNHRVIVKYTDPSTGKTMKIRSAALLVTDTPALVEVPELTGEPALNVVTGQLRDAAGNFLPEGTVLTLWGETFTVGRDGAFTSPVLPESATQAEILVQLPGGNSTTRFTAPFVSDVAPVFLDLKVGAGENGNHAPTVVVSASASGNPVRKVNPGTVVTLLAVGSDADSGDQAALVPTWSTTSGTLVDGASAFEKRWTAPDYFTVATITVEVKDSKNATGKALLPILVGIDNPSQADTGRPTVALTSDQQTVTDLAAFQVTITFNEPVSGFEQADISVVNGVLSDFTALTAGRIFRVKVTPQAAGEVQVSVAENVAVDLSNNKNTASNVIPVTATVTQPTQITSANVTITAPVLGATPQDAAAVEAATHNADYTVTGLTWNGEMTAGGQFKAGQVYTATVTLTSKNGKLFQAGAFTPTVACFASVGTTTTTGSAIGNTVSFTVTSIVDIAAAAVTITAPVLGATPQNAAAVETATGNADYSVTGLTWNGEMTAGGKFKAGFTYTATVILTSKNSKKFQAAAFTPTVAGSASVGTTTTIGSAMGNAVSFTVTYTITGARVVTSIAVTTQPRVNYTETTDGTLALNGMVVTETANDGSLSPVTFTNGTAASFTANPPNGTILSNAVHSGQPVTITHTDSGQTTTTRSLAVLKKVEHDLGGGVKFKVCSVPAATFPTGTDDSGTQTVAQPFWIGETEVTYELWYTVRMWAVDVARGANQYTFQNSGTEGSGFNDAAPTGAKNEPVTTISWRDSVVWCNALSEMLGKNPVYRTGGDVVIRSSADANAAVVDAAVATANNGFRLPTDWEWELAARWKNDSSSTNGSIERGGRFWTPGNYASGATADYTNAAATQLAAWYGDNSDTGGGLKTQNAGQKPASGNHLGVYDMSGNIYEWCWDIRSGTDRVLRGGRWNAIAFGLQVGNRGGRNPSLFQSDAGFRVVRP